MELDQETGGQYFLFTAKCTLYPEAYLNSQAHVAVCTCSLGLPVPAVSSTAVQPLYSSSLQIFAWVLFWGGCCAHPDPDTDPSIVFCICWRFHFWKWRPDSTAACVLWLMSSFNGTELYQHLYRSPALLWGLWFAIHLTGDSWFMLCKQALDLPLSEKQTIVICTALEFCKKPVKMPVWCFPVQCSLGTGWFFQSLGECASCFPGSPLLSQAFPFRGALLLNVSGHSLLTGAYLTGKDTLKVYGFPLFFPVFAVETFPQLCIF